MVLFPQKAENLREFFLFFMFIYVRKIHNLLEIFTWAKAQ